MDKLTYNVPEVATVLGIGRNAAYELVQREDFPAVRLGERRVVVPKKQLEAWLEKQTEGGS